MGSINLLSSQKSWVTNKKYHASSCNLPLIYYLLHSLVSWKCRMLIIIPIQTCPFGLQRIVVHSGPVPHLCWSFHKRSDGGLCWARLEADQTCKKQIFKILTFTFQTYWASIYFLYIHFGRQILSTELLARNVKKRTLAVQYDTR